MCKVSQFFNTVDNNPYAAAMLLGKLFYFHKNNDIVGIAQGVSSLQMNQVVSCLLQIDATHFTLLDSVSKAQHIACLQGILAHGNLCLKLNQASLIDYAKLPQYTLMACMVLIKQHMLLRHGNNMQIDLADLFDEAHHDQIMHMLSLQVKQCESLPQDALIKMGQTEDAAKCISKLLSGHPQGFAIEAQFAEQYSGLRATIARRWKKLKQTVPLTSQAKTNLKKYTDELSKKYAEFACLNDCERIPKHETNLNESAYNNLVPTCSLMGMFAGLFTSVHQVSWVINTAKVGLCVSNAPLLFTVSMLPMAATTIMGAGIGEVCNYLGKKNTKSCS